MKFIIKHLVKDNGSINLLFPGSKEQQGILIEERIITSIQLFREAAFFELICSVIPLRRFLTAARQRGICGLESTGINTGTSATFHSPSFFFFDLFYPFIHQID
jgi:hypothetical protein